MGGRGTANKDQSLNLITKTIVQFLIFLTTSLNKAKEVLTKVNLWYILILFRILAKDPTKVKAGGKGRQKSLASKSNLSLKKGFIQRLKRTIVVSVQINTTLRLILQS